MKLHLDHQNFDACPPYNAWLDERYGERSGTLDILGFQPRPSWVLFELSPDTYEAAFADFQQEREEELREVVCNEFPAPIAHYFYRFEYGYENQLQRLHLLRDTWEATVDFLHATAVAECRFRGIGLTDPLTFQNLFTDSVAQRILNIERILAQAATIGVSLDISDVVSPDTLEKMRELNRSRNGFSHSAAQSEVQAQAWIAECYEDILEVLDELRGLADTMVLRYVGQAGTTLRSELFRGHGFTKTFNNLELTPAQSLESQRYLRPGEVLVLFKQNLFGVRPLIFFREDASGHVTKLCIFRKTRGNAPDRRIEYEVVGEALRWETERSTFQAELNELRQLFGLPPE